MATPSKARLITAAESAGEAAFTEAQPRSERLLQTRKRSRDASPASRSPAPAPRRQTGKRSHDASPPSPAVRECDQGIVWGSADDAEAEFNSSAPALLHYTNEEMLSKYKRLYMKRANMALAWHHERNPEHCYEFMSVLLNDVYPFMDGGIGYMHLNFKARNVATGSEVLVFAELALKNSVFDKDGGYSTTACSIVDDNCIGGMRHREDLSVERYDEKHCYVCPKEIKHPVGKTYEGGHYAEDYCVF